MHGNLHPIYPTIAAWERTLATIESLKLHLTAAFPLTPEVRSVAVGRPLRVCPGPSPVPPLRRSGGRPEPTARQRARSAVKYSMLFVVLFAVLVTLGLAVPFAPPPPVNSTAWHKFEFLVNELETECGCRWDCGKGRDGNWKVC